MSNEIKDVSKKKPHIRFYQYVINMKTFNPINIKVDEKAYLNFLIYYVRYVMMKDWKYVKINI